MLYTQNITLPNCCTCNLDYNNTVMKIMEHFNRTCKTLTTVYAFKYQLQRYLFHDDNNATTKVLQDLTSIVIGLEAMASYLQEIATNNVRNYMLYMYYLINYDVITGYSVYKVQS